MQKLENVHNFIKCTLQQIYSILKYEIYSPLPSKLPREIRNIEQNCTKKGATCCAIKVTE